MQNDSSNGHLERPFQLDLALIYHVAFRQKWKLIVCTLAGLVAAATCYFIVKPLYQSSARLQIEYVRDTQAVNAVEGGAPVRAIDTRGEMILNTEQQFLQSLDLMKEVAKAIGPSRILRDFGGGDNAEVAASCLAGQLGVNNPPRTMVIALAMRHPNGAIAQEALSKLIEAYQTEHKRLHSLTITEGKLLEKAEQYRRAIREIDEQLLAERQKIGGGLSLADGDKSLAEQIRRVREDISKVRTERNISEARIKILKGQDSRNEQAEVVLPPDYDEKVERYREIIAELNAVRQNIAAAFNLTSENPRRRYLDQEKKRLEGEKRKLDAEYPQLAVIGVPTATGDPAFDIGREIKQVQVYDFEIERYREDLTNLVQQAEAFEKAKPTIDSLVHRKEAHEALLNTLLAAKDQSRNDFGSDYSNIQVLEQATPPIRDDKLRMKGVVLSLMGGLALGIALALLSEFFLDQTIKRGDEIEKDMNLPLFVSIPRMKHQGDSKKLLPHDTRRPTESGDAASTDGAPHDNSVEAGLRPFFGALRDRTIMYLERLTHKPKLIAVTGCNEGSGVTTIASGLAKALSETAEGRVLLVDMNHADSAAHPFLNGQRACALADVLEQDKRQTGFVQENLYLATTAEQTEHTTAIVPKRFASLVPKLKASDYDYVIFDMPPVSSLSVTPRLAGLMDIVLLVVESERSQRNTVRRANTILKEAKANVRAVLNSHRSYIPKWLYDEA